MENENENEKYEIKLSKETEHVFDLLLQKDLVYEKMYALEKQVERLRKKHTYLMSEFFTEAQEILNGAEVSFIEEEGCDDKLITLSDRDPRNDIPGIFKKMMEM
jgi:hypothetical protein